MKTCKQTKQERKKVISNWTSATLPFGKKPGHATVQGCLPAKVWVNERMS